MLGGRSTVGLRALDADIGVRIPASQPIALGPPLLEPAITSFSHPASATSRSRAARASSRSSGATSVSARAVPRSRGTARHRPSRRKASLGLAGTPPGTGRAGRSGLRKGLQQGLSKVTSGQAMRAASSTKSVSCTVTPESIDRSNAPPNARARAASPPAQSTGGPRR